MRRLIIFAFFVAAARMPPTTIDAFHGIKVPLYTRPIFVTKMELVVVVSVVIKKTGEGVSISKESASFLLVGR